MKNVILAVGLAALTSVASAEVVFSDDFETGDFSKWTDINSTAGHIQGVCTTAQAHSPTQSAFLDQGGTAATDRFAASLTHAIPNSNVCRFKFWFYDNVVTGGGRMYGEVRSYSGDAYNAGALEQLYAIGKFNNVTYPGETFKTNKYNGRIAFGTPNGWFSLDDVGSPNRSVGWHEFRIDIDAANAKFYVDGILCKTKPRGTAGSIDSVIMGSALSSSANPGYFDDYSVEDIDPFTRPDSYTVIEGVEFAGDLAGLFNSDDSRLDVLSDSDTLRCIIDFSGTTTVLAPTSVKFIFEGSAGRLGLSQALSMYNFDTASFQGVDGRTAPITDTVIEVTMTGTAGAFVGDEGQLLTRVEWAPINDEDPATDSWVLSTDQAKWQIE